MLAVTSQNSAAVRDRWHRQGTRAVLSGNQNDLRLTEKAHDVDIVEYNLGRIQFRFYSVRTKKLTKSITN